MLACNLERNVTVEMNMTDTVKLTTVTWIVKAMPIRNVVETGPILCLELVRQWWTLILDKVYHVPIRTFCN